MIQEMFGEENAAIIWQFPIGSNNNSERQVWNATANKEFIVRSAYHLHKEILANAHVQDNTVCYGKEIGR